MNLLMDLNGEEIKEPRIRGYWDIVKVVTEPEGESLTVDAPSFETDVNEIVSRFERTGYLPTGDRIPQYADVTALQIDLTEALEQSKSVLSRFDDFAEKWSPQSADDRQLGIQSPEPRRRRKGDNLDGAASITPTGTHPQPQA